MARIAWFDALARRRTGDHHMSDCVLLNPIRDDLLEFLWLNERYDCKGRRARHFGFMFYPALVVMLLREV